MKRQYFQRCSIITNEPSLLPHVSCSPSDPQLCFALYYVTVSIVIQCPSSGNDECQSLNFSSWKRRCFETNLLLLFGYKFMQSNFAATNLNHRVKCAWKTFLITVKPNACHQTQFIACQTFDQLAKAAKLKSMKKNCFRRRCNDFPFWYRKHSPRW